MGEIMESKSSRLFHVCMKPILDKMRPLLRHLLLLNIVFRQTLTWDFDGSEITILLHKSFCFTYQHV